MPVGLCRSVLVQGFHGPRPVCLGLAAECMHGQEVKCVPYIAHRNCPTKFISMAGAQFQSFLSLKKGHGAPVRAPYSTEEFPHETSA